MTGGNYVDVRVRRPGRRPLRPERARRAGGDHLGRRRHEHHRDGRGPRALPGQRALSAGAARRPRCLAGDRGAERPWATRFPWVRSPTSPSQRARRPSRARTPAARPGSSSTSPPTDVGGYVARARELVDRHVALPEGVSMVWSGQYEYMQRANERLAIVLPVTLALIFILLYAHFRRFGESIIVMVGTAVFAPIGGVWLLYLSGYNLSIAAGVGFIALLGTCCRDGRGDAGVPGRGLCPLRRRGGGCAPRPTCARRSSRARWTACGPKLMGPSATTMIGLLPVMIGTETGTRVMKRIAAPMVGGMASSTLLDVGGDSGVVSVVEGVVSAGEGGEGRLSCPARAYSGPCLRRELAGARRGSGSPRSEHRSGKQVPRLARSPPRRARRGSGTRRASGWPRAAPCP